MLKAWHTHGNTLPGGADFYPLLAKVGKGVIEQRFFHGDQKRGWTHCTPTSVTARLPSYSIVFIDSSEN